MTLQFLISCTRRKTRKTPCSRPKTWCLFSLFEFLFISYTRKDYMGAEKWDPAPAKYLECDQ